MDAWITSLLAWLALPEFGLSTVFVVSFISATLLPLQAVGLMGSDVSFDEVRIRLQSLTITLARELKRSGLRYGISSACVGGGQGIALLIENPEGTV